MTPRTLVNYTPRTPEEIATKRAEMKKKMEAEHMAFIASLPEVESPKMDDLNSWIEVCSNGYQGD